LQKKGTFNDVGLGLITDTEDKNKKLREKVTKMKKELEQAKVVADEAKSTWEKLRKERDFHKTHQNRVEGEKVQINQGIKKIKDLHEQYEDRLEEIQHKYEQTLKEKALLKLEKDKLAKRINTISKQIKDQQDRVTREIEENHKKQKLQAAANNRGDGIPVKGKATPWPEDARPNPFLAKTYEDLNPRLQF
jgi:chromosome segregation ATPase